MIICICNGTNDRMVADALASGASKVAHLYRHNGCTPKCGKCLPIMRERLARYLAEGKGVPATEPSAIDPGATGPLRVTAALK